METFIWALEIFFLSGAFFYHQIQLLSIVSFLTEGALWPKIYFIGWP